MIPLAVVALLALAALIYVLLPLRASPAGAEPARDTLLEEARARKLAALGAILDLEAEREVGKLAEADFAVLAGEYEREAVAALKEIDALESRSLRLDEHDELESEIAALRRRIRGASSDV